MRSATSSHLSSLAAPGGGGGHGGVLALVVSLVGVIALFAWIGYRHGPTLLRFTGIALWWAGWACGSQGGFGDMAVLLVLGTLAWAVGTRWYARRRGRWPSPLSARLLDRHTNRPTP